MAYPVGYGVAPKEYDAVLKDVDWEKEHDQDSDHEIDTVKDTGGYVNPEEPKWAKVEEFNKKIQTDDQFATGYDRFKVTHDFSKDEYYTDHMFQFE